MPELSRALGLSTNTKPGCISLSEFALLRRGSHHSFHPLANGGGGGGRDGARGGVVPGGAVMGSGSLHEGSLATTTQDLSTKTKKQFRGSGDDGDGGTAAHPNTISNAVGESLGSIENGPADGGASRLGPQTVTTEEAQRATGRQLATTSQGVHVSGRKQFRGSDSDGGTAAHPNTISNAVGETIFGGENRRKTTNQNSSESLSSSASASPTSNLDPTMSYAVAKGNHTGQSSNAYSSGSNQNCGNVLTDRPTTRLHAPPGGKSSFSLGGSLGGDPDDGGTPPSRSRTSATMASTSTTRTSATMASTSTTRTRTAAAPFNNTNNTSDGTRDNNGRPPRVCEYVWVNDGGSLSSSVNGRPSNLRSQSVVVAGAVPLDQLPSSTCYSTGGAEIELRPRRVCANPLRMNGGGSSAGAGFGSGSSSVEAPAVVVLCDCYDHDGNPLASNARVAAEKVFASIADTGHNTQFTAHQQYVPLKTNANDD